MSEVIINQIAWMQEMVDAMHAMAPGDVVISATPDKSRPECWDVLVGQTEHPVVIGGEGLVRHEAALVWAPAGGPSPSGLTHLAVRRWPRLDPRVKITPHGGEAPR